MKKRNLLTVIVLLSLFTLLSSPVQAADAYAYFENPENYDAYNAGNGKIHVKLLVFGEKGDYNYNAGRGQNRNLENEYDPTPDATGSRLYTERTDVTNDRTVQLYYWGDNYYNRSASSGSHKWPKDKGVVWVQLQSGVLVCTNTYEGIDRTVTADGTVVQIELKRKDEGGHRTYFEFDWYPPTNLDGKDFLLKVMSDHHRSNGSYYRSKEHNFGEFTGADQDQAPIITDPFFYAANDKGRAGYGKLAMVYSSMTKVDEYYTSHDLYRNPITEQSDMLFVQPEDTVIQGYRLCFHKLRSTDQTTWNWVWSNKVDVPAYHKLYNFFAAEYRYHREDVDKWYYDRRYKKLTWEIRYPQEEDAMATDYFEIQRAYNEDFSDAVTIDVIDMDYDASTTQNNIQTYTYVDSTEGAWWNPVQDNGKIYYRVRRASSAVWGWDSNPYALSTEVNFNHLSARFNSTTHGRYWLDEDFANNNEVHIRLSLFYSTAGGERTYDSPGYSYVFIDPNQKLMLRKILVESRDTMIIEIPHDSLVAAFNRAFYHPDKTEYFAREKIEVNYIDHANTPCVHYTYEAYMDTTDVIIKNFGTQDARLLTTPLPLWNEKGVDIYYTEAANINTFAGSDHEFSEYVLLTWDATEGDIGSYAIETRPNAESAWTPIVSGIEQNWYQDRHADPEISDTWQYRLTMSYECNGNHIERSAITSGSRYPYGKVSGRVTYADGTGCPDVEVNASRVSDGAMIQRVYTDESGYYLFDSLPYGGDAQYAVMPVSQHAEFRYNNTSATFAGVTLSLDRSVATGIDFANISFVRVSGRVLYENSTIPVRDANFLVNGKLVQVSGYVYKTDASGNFEFSVPKDAAFTMQVVKDHHVFAGEGYVRIEGDSLLTLSKAQDGIRLYDQTKVRLIGRLAGGNNQASKPLGHGLSTNYLGDDLKMVFELEGDNISHIVHFSADPDKDTIQQRVDSTATLFEKKRITIYPDVRTGEYAVDLFPVRYKITQATARGYATLFADGKTSETLDLSDAAIVHKEDVYEGDTVRYNASYCITYHSPISISCTQLRFGREIGWYGEENMVRKNILNEKIVVPLVMKQKDGSYNYLFGAPVFNMDKYTFRVTAHEDYYYNNNELSTKHEEVRIKGGKLKVYNGLYEATNTEIESYDMDMNGQQDITVPVNYVSFMKTGEEALRVLDLSVEYEGMYVESQPIRAYVAGNKTKGKDYVSSGYGSLLLLDILRDPPGSQSYSFIESGTTYQYNYTYEFDLTFGLDLSIGAGSSDIMTMGSVVGVPSGMYAGYVVDLDHTYMGNIPITSNYYYKRAAHYTFQTQERIETDNEKYFVDQTGNGKYFVGQEADVYIGAVQNVYNGITDAVKPIDSLTYATLKARERPDGYGSLKTVATGRDAEGRLYYLVVGAETEAGLYLKSSFIYTHDYIEHTLLPQLKQRRDNLLLTCDSTTAQEIANAQHKQVYWSKLPPESDQFGEEGTYLRFKPAGSQKQYPNEVEDLTNEMAGWLDLFCRNETDKINAIYSNSSKMVGRWSVSGGTKMTHTELYEYGNNYSRRVDYPGTTFTMNKGIDNDAFTKFGKAVADKLDKLQNTNRNNDADQKTTKQTQEILTQTPGWKLKFSIKPVLDIGGSYDPNHTTTHTKKAGFVLETDNFGHESVTVYRVVTTDSLFNASSKGTRDFLTQNSKVGNKSDNSPDSLYGSYVFFLEGGASRCPHEPAYTTNWYSPAMPLSAGTLNLENQKIDVNVHERSNVPADQPAVFLLRLSNESEGDFGGSALPITFYLKQKEGSNSHGARLIIDGMPLTGDGRAIKLFHNEVVTKTLQVYAGEGYDYEDIVLELVSPCDPYNKSACTISVHYLPVSCPVNITAPHDKWVMNTLSSLDSLGYYLPVVIDGFDVNYNGFDHIEFQYKLSTQSDEAWVNLCSYYADDSLYNTASGNKAMIKGGRIENIHFYGERDPMEQQYDLRAVSYCRYGNGFIYRASPVLTGIKDTRPPRVFGQPEPANSILGVGNNLLLRFNEAIAGNYLDEDNNFQLLGVTNDVALTTGASLAFDGSASSYAATKVNRSLAEKSFSIDLMVKPVGNIDEMFFLHGDGNDMLLFGKTWDNKLVLHVGMYDSFFSKPLDAPITAFTRVIVTYNHETGDVRFYAGSQEVTDYSGPHSKILAHNAVMPLTFGLGYEGNMLEARIWTKALTPAEIANTAGRYLTGYERELLAYYPMNEGKGEVLTDKANGATLYATGTTWSLAKGLSIHLNVTDSVELAGDLLARSSVQDETLMFWFKTSLGNADIFTAASGFRVAIENGNLVMQSENQKYELSGMKSPVTDGSWHHFVVTINRTYNNVTVFLDGEAVQSLHAGVFGSISGRMYFGGDGFEGNIDELCVFEQALPKALIEEFGTLSPFGDEMGLMAFLPFEQTKENENGIIELVYSPNDQRVFKDSKGNVLNKEVPLVIAPQAGESLADKISHAPVHSHGQLTKLHFDWSFNNDELIINILNQDSEINKQSVYVTVRDVEDLNGNPMTSPVTWTAFVDRNSLKWEDDDLEIFHPYGAQYAGTEFYDFRIINNSGKRHQYTIESLPDWLRAEPMYGSIKPMEDKSIRFWYNYTMQPGKYMDIVYLTDEEGLCEPLEVSFTVDAMPPYTLVDKNKYPLTMSLCGKVLVNNLPDVETGDQVFALYHNECIGMANVGYQSPYSIGQMPVTNDLYLTIYGCESMSGKAIRFVLWQASTGKTFNLNPSVDIAFKPGDVVGCGYDEPVVLATGGAETQNIEIPSGWSWVSFHMDVETGKSPIRNVLSAAEPWVEGDLIKTPETRQFCTYSETIDAFVGTLSALDYHDIYMVYAKSDNTLRVSADQLTQDKMMLTLRGNGQWSSLPCLLSEITPVTEALAGYYDYATPGDIVKGHDRFAVFSADKKWVGDLPSLRPGDGYLFRRIAEGDVQVPFFNKTTKAPKRRAAVEKEPEPFHGSSATNMTMICAIKAEGYQEDETVINAYIGSDLVGVAKPLALVTEDGQEERYYFLTIQSDKTGSVRFETSDGVVLTPSSEEAEEIRYAADSHHGSLKKPVVLVPGENRSPYKIIENDHVVIIRNQERYDVTGKKLR